MARKPHPRKHAEIDVDELLAHGRSVCESDPSEGLAIARQLLRATVAGSGDRAKAHVLAGMCELNLGNVEAAKSQFERALRIDPLEPADAVMARHGLGNALTERGEWIRAIQIATDALELAGMHGLRRYECLALNTLGIVYRSLGDAARALECWQRAMEIAVETGSRQNQMLVGSNMAIVHAMLDDLDTAERILLDALALGNDRENARLRTIAYQNLGNICQRRGDAEGYAKYAMLAVELSRTLPAKQQLVWALMDMALVAFNSGESDRALALATEAVEATEVDSPLNHKAFGLFGYIKLMCGDVAPGLDALHRSLEGHERFQDWQGIEVVTQTLVDYYRSVGDADRTLEYHERHSEIVERTRGREQQRKVMQMEMRAEIERIEQEREAERRKAEELAREVESKEKELAALALNLVDKSRFLDSLKEEISEVTRDADTRLRPQIRSLIRSVERKADWQKEWRSFEQQFDLLHDGFLRSLSQRWPELTRTELKVCALLKLNLASKEMCEILSISMKTIETHRRSIRRKLKVPDEISLTTYFVAL